MKSRRAGGISTVLGVALLAFLIACSDSTDPITVPPPPAQVASVRLTPATVVLEEGRTRQLTAVGLDVNGNVLEGRAVQWSAEPASVATVSASGLVQAIGRGYAMVTATVEGRSASSAITVTEPEPLQQFDLVYERRPFNGGGDIRRVSIPTGVNVTLPLAVTVEGTFVRDVTPSPDGTRVAFTVAWYPQGWSTLDGDIYVANIDGTNFQRLTTAPDLDDQPAWSPDGSRIAFRSKRSGEWDIWVMGANGSGQTNLMDSWLPARATDQTPAWSADGSRIVFASDMDNLAYSKLWTMRPDGSDKRRLLPLTGATSEIDREPSWSPDGSRVAFRRVSSNALGSDIMVANVVTGVVNRIQMDGVQAMPAWSPDGVLIAFTSNHEGLLSHIYTMKPDGTGIVRHTTGADENTYPRWLRTALPAN